MCQWYSFVASDLSHAAGLNDGGPRVERASRAYQACVHHHRHRGDPFRSSWSVVELRGAGDCSVAPGGSTREMISTTSGDRQTDSAGEIFTTGRERGGLAAWKR
jgi:hypothetical protein